MTDFTFHTLERIIDDRTRADWERSYTKSLLEAGAGRIAKKFGEESVELVIASLSGKQDEIVAEAADVVYHLLVLLKGANVSLDDVLQELNRRTSKSGLEEKASRTK